jgi:hypothetical protein
MEGDLLAIEVVRRLATGGEGEVAELEGPFAKQRDESGAIVHDVKGRPRGWVDGASMGGKRVEWQVRERRTGRPPKFLKIGGGVH